MSISVITLTDEITQYLYVLSKTNEFFGVPNLPRVFSVNVICGLVVHSEDSATVAII